MMVINNKFSIGETVYLITDEMQLPRLVTCLKVCPNGCLYELTSGSYSSVHYDFEISSEKKLIDAI